MKTQTEISTVSDRLRVNSERILNSFVQAVRTNISEAKTETSSVLKNALPLLLEQLEESLKPQVQNDTQEVKKVGRAHADQRVKLTNFSLSNVLNEYHILRKIILEVLSEESPLSFEDSDIINSVIDTGVAEAAKQFMQRSDDRLIESQEHFRLLVEGTFEYAIFMLSPDGIIQTWNKGAERIKGYKPEEIIGKHFSIFYPPEAVVTGHPEHELRIATSEGKFVEDGLRLRKDGTSFQANVVINALKDENGKLKGFSKVTRDLTGRKNAENHFRTFADSINQLAWMADEKGEVNWFNHRWYEYTGTNLKEMEGWGWQCVHPDALPMVKEKWKHSLSTGTAFDMTYPFKSTSGEYRSFLTRVIPFRDAEGRIMKWFGTNTDIHDQKEVEKSLAEAKDKATLALKVRDEFISVASHELKTPLTALMLQVQMRSRRLLNKDLPALSQEQIAKMIETDNRQLERITRLIDDMLDVSRINNGKLTISSERFDLCTLVQEVLDSYFDQFQSIGSKISLVCCDPVEGNWDRFRIEQAVSNILINAIKYGGGKVIEVSVGHDNCYAKLTVKDQGIGIATENIQRIFNRFERAVLPNEVSGLGLGLFITKKIIEIHGGSIRVESELGHGSSFIIQLPMNPPVQNVVTSLL